MPADVLRLGDGVELDRGAYELRRFDRALKLERIPMEILLLLVERRGQLVSREDIIEKVWGKDVHLDTDASINAAIRKIRQVLKDDPERPVFVQTVTGKGYRFIAPVGELADPIPENSSRGNGTVRLQEDAIASPVRDNGTAHLALHEPTPVPGIKRKLSARLLLSLAVCVAVALMAARFRPVARPPQVKRIRQLTHVGTVIRNQNLMEMGSRLYFMVTENGETQLRSVSLDGENILPVEKPFRKFEFFDVLPSRNELLIAEIVHGFSLTEWRRAVWRVPLPGGPPRRVGDLFADGAVWSPDGRTIAYTNEGDQSLNLADGDGGNLRKLATFPGVPIKPRWSPDGKLLRLSVMDPKGAGISLWQSDASGRNVTRVLPGWGSATRAWAGRWTHDGRYFLFTGLQSGKRNVWALRDKRDIFHRDGTQPVQLTDGILDFHLPTPSSDGKTIYAVGTQQHGQLMRYNASSRQYEPYLDGISADQLDFSRDGKWVAYVAYPEGTLIRSRMDGSERVQLTFAPMRVYRLRWSPDGSQIAFEGHANLGMVHQVYLVSANGGSPRLAVPGSNAEQVMPDWTADGRTLIFAGSDTAGAAWALHALNLKTGAETPLPGTLGTDSGRVSPDGRYVAGVSVPGQNLIVYDIVAGTTRKLAEYANYPCWSPDGKYIYYSTVAAGFILPPEKIGTFRVKVADASIERAAPAPAFLLTGSWGFYNGLTPDGSVLLLRELGTSDIYALDADLP